MKLTTEINSIQVRVENIQEEALAFLEKYGFNLSIPDVNYRTNLYFVVYLKSKIICIGDSFRTDLSNSLHLEYSELQALIKENFKPVFVFELGKKYYSYYNYVIPMENYDGKIVFAGCDNNPFRLYRNSSKTKAEAIDYIVKNFPYDNPLKFKIQD